MRRLIFLIGSRGAGKTTVARILAAKLGWSWTDADAVLKARFGRSIDAIFAAEGEPAFRDKESLVLEGLCRLTRHVVATGGGVVLRPENRDLLKAAGHVVWLTADTPTLWHRLQTDPATAGQRPDLAGGGFQEVIDLLRIREPCYAACADWTIDTTNPSADEVAAAILQWLSVQSNP